MATEEQKHKALKSAVEIAKEYAGSSSDAYPDGVLKEAYRAIVEIVDEIEKAGD